MRIIFWAGQEYYNCYLDDSDKEYEFDIKALLSEDMLNKLIYVFDNANLSYDELE